MNIDNNKLQAVEWFKSLRNEICKIFEQLEIENNGQMSHKEPGNFSRKNWSRPGGGGGEMSIMRGRVFEKVGVNFSEVYGKFSENMMSKIKGASKDEDIKVDNSSFLKAIWTVLLADFTMSLDNVLGVAGAAGHHYHLLVFGLILSIVLMAVAANLISGWIKKYKWIAWVGLLAILIVAIELIYTDIKTLFF